ncbi:MAG: acyl-CoA thioesterase II [Pseudochelatococcus sp.]|jgi:acyl-CoA thioesterase-2|uniref:acyl-CoA thioesterase II n=1 Tax=Pseudochelatococcus sp. TaxID=2020869 RepID=UPI003D8A10DB
MSTDENTAVNPAVAGLLSILDLEALEDDLFRGNSPQEGWQRVFGGQVIGQALVAATRTVAPERNVHSLHCYFVLPGDPTTPIIYAVKRIRDGGSFTTRHVEAVQHGRVIFTLIASFHKEEPGLRHQPPMPVAPPPEETVAEEVKSAFLQRIPPHIRAYFERERPIELRPVDYNRFNPGVEGTRKPAFSMWIRATGPLPDDEAIHRCVLAYASDMTLLDTSLAVHGRSVFDGDIQGASLDHAMWFHRPFRADEWLLYSQESPFSGGGRGLSRGLIFTRDGLHVATVAQEGLIRPVRDSA